MLRIKLPPQPTPCPNKSCLEGNWWCLWYRWRKYLILIRIRLNFFLVLLLLLLLFLVLLLAREKERLWTSVSKWGGLFLCGDQVCWNAIRKKPNIRQESHHLSLVISLISSKQRFVCGNFVNLRKTSTHCIVCYGHHTVSFFVNKRGPSVYCLKGGSFAILGYILGSVHGKGNMKGTIRILNKCAQ